MSHANEFNLKIRKKTFDFVWSIRKMFVLRRHKNEINQEKMSRNKMKFRLVRGGVILTFFCFFEFCFRIMVMCSVQLRVRRFFFDLFHFCRRKTICSRY